jgi:hypothetical protein
MLELGADVELECIGTECGSGNLVGTHPSHSEADSLGDGEIASQGVTLDIGAATAKVGVSESVHYGIRLNIPVADASLPVTEGFKSGLSNLERDVPCETAAFKGTGLVGRPGTPVVDGNRRDVRLIKGDVLSELANQGKA